jgi:tetratricopeptide (TPR) repeat protein
MPLRALVLLALLAASQESARAQTMVLLEKCADAGFMGVELAIQYCDRALASSELSVGEKFVALYQRGQLHARNGQLEKSLSDFDAALRQRPESVQDRHLALVYLARGGARLRRQLDAKAFEDFSEALRLNPELGDAYVSRGHSWLRRNEPVKAIEDFNEAMRKEPASTFALRQLRIPLASRQALDRKELEAAAYNGRGMAYAKQGNAAKAIEDFSEAIRLRPELSGPLVSRAAAYSVLNDFEHALADLDAGLRIRPRDPLLFFVRGVTHYRNKTFERATADLDEAIRLNVRFREAYLWRGLAWAERSDFERALADIDQALSLEPGNRQAIAVRISVLKRREAARKTE